MVQLKKSLSLPTLIFYGTGMIFGAGIYSIIGTAAGKSGDALWQSFALSAVIVFLTALTYCELATLYPEAGAEFIYLRKAFPKIPTLAFVTALFVALSGAATTATVSISFAGYLQHFVETPILATAFLILIVMSAVALWGIEESSRVNTIFTIIEALGLLLFIILGAIQPKFGEAFLSQPHLGVVSAASLVFFSFLGFESIANLAEEAKNPKKDIPLAMLYSLGIATLLYILVALSAVALIPSEKLAASQSPLSTAAAHNSTTIAGILGAIALFATANTALISVIAASRIIFSMGREKELPAIFGKTGSKKSSPYAATVLVFAVSLLLLPLGKVDIVASVSSLATILAFLAANFALIALRFHSRESARSFQVKPSIGFIPLPSLVAIVFLLILLTQFETTVYLVGGGAIAVVIVFRFIWKQIA